MCLLKVNKTVGNGFWGYTFAVGYAPALTNEGLEAVNIIDFSTSDFEPALAMMLTYQPDEFGPIRLGAFYVSSTLASEVVSIKEIEQNVVGAFFYGDWIQWKITAALFSLDNKVISTTSESDSQFSSGYFQVDYMFSRKWTIFGRVEESAGVTNDAYLSLFPGFVTSRTLLGARYDIIKNHALTMEFGKVDISNEGYHHISMQWSAMFL